MSEKQEVKEELSRDALIQKMKAAAESGEGESIYGEDETQEPEEALSVADESSDEGEELDTQSEGDSDESEEVETKSVHNELDEYGDSDAIKEEARRGGWAPLEKWKGDPKDWKTAHEFVGLGKKVFSDLREKNDALIKQMSSIEKKNEKMMEAIIKMNKDHQEDKRLAVQQALESREQERQEAILDGDPQRVAELENEMAQIRTRYPEEDQSEDNEPDEQSNPAFEAWIKNNDWYNTNKKAAAIADSIGLTFTSTGRYNITDPELFELVDEEMKFRYPDLFKEPEPEVNPNRDKPSSVGRSTKKAPQKSKPKFSALTSDQQRQYEFMSNQFKDIGETFMSKDEWAERMLGEE